MLAGRPSARTVNLKRLEDDALIFTSALWTRKAKEIEANPNVALLFHWPALGREATIAGRVLAEVQETAPACPRDWGALRVRPQTIELWSEAADRLHERRLFERNGEGWTITLLSP